MLPWLGERYCSHRVLDGALGSVPILCCLLDCLGVFADLLFFFYNFKFLIFVYTSPSSPSFLSSLFPYLPPTPLPIYSLERVRPSLGSQLSSPPWVPSPPWVRTRHPFLPHPSSPSVGLLFEARSHSVAQAGLGYSLCSPSWIQTYNNAPASEITSLVYHTQIAYSGFKQNGSMLGTQQKWNVPGGRA